ncbi:hypothetical protein I3760_02G066600 [Carya illinoinensis]|nr:hypothetical protein I3760_02G066600 [Carya illinoinensis]
MVHRGGTKGCCSTASVLRAPEGCCEHRARTPAGAHGAPCTVGAPCSTTSVLGALEGCCQHRHGAARTRAAPARCCAHCEVLPAPPRCCGSTQLPLEAISGDRGRR